MTRRIWRNFENFLTLVIIPFVPYTPSPDSPQHSESPPESQTIQITHTRRPDNPQCSVYLPESQIIQKPRTPPSDSPQHSEPQPESQTIQIPHTPSADSSQHSGSPPESETIQIPHTPRPNSPQHSQSPPGSHTIQIPRTNPTDSTDQPAPRPGGERPHAHDCRRMSMETRLLVMGVCLTAVGVALQAPQTSTPLPMIYHHWVCMLLELSFVFMMSSVYIRVIRPLNERASLVMDEAAILFLSTAFMLAISMIFPSPFLEISVALHFGLVLHIIVANIFRAG